jgi:thymidylate synthase (FAD)
MKIVNQSVEILSRVDGADILKTLELAGRTCYKSEDNITDDSANKFVAMLIDRGHEAMIEHYNITAKFVCDRGVSHEIVRHRIASYAQESTRYCNYSKEKFGNEITVIEPKGLTDEQRAHLYNACKAAELFYFLLLEDGCSAQIARSVLPTCLKTEIVVTMNLREWRHFFKLRTAKVAHPQMREVASMLLLQMKELIPVIFDDIMEEK